MDSHIRRDQEDTDDDEIRFYWWQGGRRAEHEKLMSHIVVLRQRLQRLRAVSLSNGRPASIQPLVDRALRDESWRAGGEDAHRYADSLEEMVPLIADEPYLAAVINQEISHPDPAERVTLTTLFERGDLQGLMFPPNSCDSSSPSHPPYGDHAGEVLRLLFQKRAELMRHERLMRRLRQYFLPRLALILASLLAATSVTIVVGQSDSLMPTWAQLLIATWLGALGGTLSATLRLRDISELNSFRAVSTYLFVQPLIGAAFGLVSWLILLSGEVTIGSSPNWKTNAIVAFAVGYSEPFFVGILRRVMGLTAPSSHQGSPAGPNPGSPHSIVADK